jgi:predicted transcriptional regulator
VINLAENNKTYKEYKMIPHDKIFHVISYPPARKILGMLMDDSTHHYTQIKDMLGNEFNVDMNSLGAYIIKKLLSFNLIKKDERTKLYYITTTGKEVYKGSQFIMKGINLDMTDIDLQGKLKIRIERGNL